MRSLILYFWLAISASLTASKEEGKFRIEKINFVWSKAVSQLAVQPKRLDKLRNDLITFDELYLGAKQDLHHAKLSSGKGIDEIDRKLESLLQRYDLEDTIHAFRLKYKYDTDKIYSTSDEYENSTRTHYAFGDARVQKLWESVKNDAAFTLVELDDLYYDLREHEKKLSEYNALLKELSHRETLSNHVAKQDHGDADDAEHNTFLAAVKRMNVELEENLRRFESRVDATKRNPFKHQKVRRLWEKANKKPDLIPNELDAIKSELRHFERHLEKIDYHRTQLREAEEFARGPGKNSAQDDDGGLTADLREHHERMLLKIKKLEHYLNEKFDTPQHSEL